MARRRARGGGPIEPPDDTAAMEIAARFLGTRPRTRWEVERRLRRAGAAEPVITATLDRLVELGYLDDAAFARWWSEGRDRGSPRGRRMIEAELRQHGVPRDVIEAHRDEHAAPERGPDAAALPASEDERARAALHRHLRGRPMPADRPGLQRLGMFLVRRGFDPDTVRSALRAAASGDAEGGEDVP
jgi:regulatory protein